MEVHMTRKSFGLISVILVVVIGLVALIAVPAVRADTPAPVTAADKAATDAKLAELKALGQQVREAAKAVQERVKAAKAAGKDLSAFRAGIAKALKGGRHMRIDFKRMQRPQLTEAERVQLKAIETSVRDLKIQIKAKIDAKGTPAEIDALKVPLKAAMAAREALVKAFRARARAQFLLRLDNLIADAKKELTFLEDLLNRLQLP
jgi:ABC-type phosphate transport system auxiliary subunit